MIRILTDNLGLKLFSVAASAALWLVFVGEAEVAASVPLAVHYRNVPRDLEISSDHIDRVYLKLRGPSTQLTPDALTGSAVTLDLASVNKAGEQTFTLDRSHIDLPAGVHMTQVIPSQIRLRFERRISKPVPADVRFAGPPPEGYRILHMKVEPQRLNISGPESRVDQIESAATDPIDLAGKVGTAEFRVPVYLDDPYVRFQSSPVVTVRVVLEKIPVRDDQ